MVDATTTGKRALIDRALIDRALIDRALISVLDAADAVLMTQLRVDAACQGGPYRQQHSSSGSSGVVAAQRCG